MVLRFTSVPFVCHIFMAYCVYRKKVLLASSVLRKGPDAVSKFKPAPEEIRKWLDYNPLTGEFHWKAHWAPTCQWIVGTRAGGKDANGAWLIGFDGDQYYAHAMAWAYVHGYWPPQGVDHKDRDPLNNRLANLRLANQHQNMGNSRKRKKNGLKGAIWCADRSHLPTPWAARIKVHYQPVYLGYHATEEAAHEAYKKAAVKYFGEFARFE